MIKFISKHLKSIFLFFIFSSLVIVVACQTLFRSENKISFNTEVRPILNAKCTGCHGGVKKAGGISFIYRELALGKGESGKTCIVPGKPSESEFFTRLTHHDTELRMPLGKEPLNEKEIAILKKWIEEGANWENHWAYIKPEPKEVPDAPSKYVKNDIDNFIYAKRDELDIDLSPSDISEKAILLRRLSLDVVGLPPSVEEIENFEKDESENAYEKQVDRLLSSPAFGERWAGMWLDLARYADTKGYEKDLHRNIYRYRDYLIQSFNKDLPYDQFIREQLAGDLMPNPTENQYLATAFHRNTMSNDEGGTDNEEFRTIDVIDRVNTTFDVFQGVTMSCVQCHSHPYDPIEHKEYYQTMSFFNQTEDNNEFDEYPKYIAPADTPTVKIKELMAKIDKLNGFNLKNETYKEAKIRHALPRIEAENASQFSNIDHDDHYVYVKKENSYLKFDHVNFDLAYAIKIRHVSAGGSVAHFYIDNVNGKKIGQYELPESFNELYEFNMPISKISGTHDLFIKFTKNPTAGVCNSTIDRITVSKYKKYIHNKPLVNAYEFDEVSNVGFGMEGIHSWKENSWIKFKDIDISKAKYIGFKYTVSGGSKIEFRLGSQNGKIIAQKTISNTNNNWKEIKIPIESVKGMQNIFVVFKNDKNGNNDGMIENFVFDGNVKNINTEKFKKLDELTVELQNYLYQSGTPFLKELPENKKRITRIFNRGNWMAKTDTVQPIVPKIFNKMPDKSPSNRLGFANWITSKENPLTARVAVNRLWEQIFGYGIVETLEDFGSQGIKPSHPELLDYLALKFMNEYNWSTKKMLKFMVMSYTYQQKSEVSEKQLKLDPRNKYLARAPRVRLSAEQVRDQALAVSGLLSKKMYGPSVMPYQPNGIWQTVYSGADWVTSEGEDKYRRALYTYLKRTSPFPNLLNFDGSSREVCLVRRIRTNTPLQSLATLNDTTFTEVAQQLALQSLAKNESLEQKISFMYKKSLFTNPDAKTLERLVKLYNTSKEFYNKNEQKTLKTSNIKDKNNEFSSLTIVASAIINLDKFITKE